MFKRAKPIVLGLVLLPQVSGCTSVQAVNLTDVSYPDSQEIYGVVTVDGQQLDFDQPTTDVRNDSIYATVGQSSYAIALDEVQALRLRRGDSLRTVAGILKVTLIAAQVAGAAVAGTLPGG